jgi:hypothetical protein
VPQIIVEFQYLLEFRQEIIGSGQMLYLLIKRAEIFKNIKKDLIYYILGEKQKVLKVLMQ